MSIIKTFYSKDKRHRAHIHRRKDGLIEILSDELHHDSIMYDSGVVVPDDFYWYSDKIASCITDSVEIAQEEIFRGFHYEYIEAPLVDCYDQIELKNGRVGEIVEITSTGDYIVQLDDEKFEETVSIEDIVRVIE